MNALRLLFGTLTVLPVRPPASLDRRTAGWAMTMAPLAGLALGLLVGLPMAWGLDQGVPASPLLLASLAVGVVALLTRGIHLDGLADTADGLGSGLRGDAALAVMKRSDIGPFGVVALVLVLLVQVAALAQSLAAGTGAAAVAVALVVSRGTLSALCTSAFPAARVDGLGRLVAGSVSWLRSALGLGLTAVLVLGIVVAAQPLGALQGEQGVRLAAVFPLGVIPGVLLAVHAQRRFGGVTGDVYGAVVEVTFASVLVAAAFAA